MFFPFKVDLSGKGERGFSLIPKECVVEFLVVDVKGSHVRTNAFAHLGTEGAGVGGGRGADFGYACVEEVLGELVGDFGDAAFVGEVVGGFDPVGGDGDKVSVAFEVKCEEGIGGSCFVGGDEFGVGDELFEIAY